MFRIASTIIRGVKYHPGKRILEVQFNGEESIYQYFDVPEEVWYSMQNAASVDMYFNMQVATRYKVKCVSKQKRK